MELIEAIRERRSIRAFKPDPVPKEVLTDLLETCRWSPSTSNMQTWEFAVLGGDFLERLKDRVARQLESGWDSKLLRQTKTNPDIPEPVWPEVYLRRRMAVSRQLDGSQFPSDDPAQKKLAYHLYGGRFYGAPNAIIVYTEKALCPKAIIDIGLVTQTIALAALGFDLGTCIMSMPVYWPDIVREILDLPSSKMIALSIAVGYPDKLAGVNQFQRVREPLNSNTRFYGYA